MAKENSTMRSSPPPGGNTKRSAPGLQLGDLGTSVSWLVIGSLLVVFFLVDFWVPFDLAVPASYVAALLLIVAVPNIRQKVTIAAICTGIAVLHYMLSRSGPDTPAWLIAVNHGSTVIMMWIVAILGLRHKRAENALRQSEERYRALYDETPSMYFSVDETGTVRSVNQFGAAQLGYRPEELIGRPVLEVFHQEDRAAVARHLAQAFHSRGAVIQWEFRKVRKDGLLLWVREWVRIAQDRSGVPFALIVCDDITERKQAEEALRQSEEALREADQRKDEFLATLAHELRNPLALMRNVVNLLRIPGSPEKELRWGRDIIDRQVNYLTRLTDDLFDVSRITQQKVDLNKEPVELAEVVRAAVESSHPIIDQRGHALTVTLPPEPIYVEGDKVRLAQVFMNLLSNAAKYTPKPGRIGLKMEHQPDTALVRVSDTGLGIAPENLPRVFDLFYQVDRSFTRAEGGLGLGLTLVRRLVELHGGIVEAHSAGANKGCEFIVRLPLLSIQPATQPPQTQNGNGEYAATMGRRILVADDFPDSANTLAKLLRSDGNEVQIAKDGFEALDVAANFRPDVAVLDIAMPKLSGYDVARTIREQSWGKSMVLIALTGSGQQQDRRRTKEAGFDAHLTKPVNYESFLEVLTHLSLDRRAEASLSQEL